MADLGTNWLDRVEIDAADSRQSRGCGRRRHCRATAAHDGDQYASSAARDHKSLAYRDAYAATTMHRLYRPEVGNARSRPHY